MRQPKEPTKGGENKTEAAPTVKTGRAQGAKKPDGEVGGPKGLEPTRYGDWERKGITVDF